MKRQTMVTVGLLVVITAFHLTPITAQSSEQPESSGSQIPLSSRSSRDIEVPPEQTFIELSRTKKLSSVRSRPPPRRFRTSSTPTPETQTPTKISEPEPSTTDVPTDISTTTSQPEVTATPTTAPVGRPNVTAKHVRFTKTRAAKSGRGQIFTFTFKNREDNSVKEKQHTQSRIPARFSPVFTSQTPNRSGSAPQASSETNQPENLAINSGPPGDVSRARQSGRALNLSVTAGQQNQISQSQDAETNTVPQNIGESSTTEKLVPSFRPKSKTRPHKGPINSLPGRAVIPVEPPQAVNEMQPVSEGENLSLPPRRRPLKEGLQTVFPNDSGILDELPTHPPRDSGDLSLQALNEGQSQTNTPAAHRIRYVKAGSLRFFPNRLTTSEDIQPQQAQNFAQPTAQPLIEGQDLSARDNYPEPRRPNSQYRASRPEPEGRLQDSPVNQQDFPPETIRNDGEPTPQALTLNEEHGPSVRVSLPENQSLKQGPLRLLPKNEVNSQEIPPELARDFANLQNLLASRDSAQLSLPALQRLQQPLNPESLRFLSNIPDSPQELSPQLRAYFNKPNSHPLIVNDGQEQSPEFSSKQSDRPPKETTLRFLPNKAENLEEQARDFGGPTGPTLRVNLGSLGRLQELQRSNRPLNERVALFVPIGLQGKPLQKTSDLSDPNLERPTENQGNGPIRQDVLRSNRPLNLEVLRFRPNVLRGLPPQSTYYDGQGLIRQESQGPTRPSNEESLRALPRDPQRTPPLSTRDFVDQNLHTPRQSEEQSPLRQESLRTIGPPNAGIPRFLLSDPRGLPSQSINYADPNIRFLLENEGQALARLRPNRHRLGSVTFVSNKEAFSEEQSTPPEGDNTELNFHKSQENETPPRLTVDLPINLQRANSELNINSLSNPAKQLSQLPPAREPLVRSQANQQVAAANPESNLPPSTDQPSDPPSFLSAADSNARVQPAAPTAITKTQFSVNPPTNIPRLIIEFPSSSSGNDQSIRLQLNPSSAPANGVTPTNPQPNISRVPTDAPSSSATSDTSNNHTNQQNLPTNGGTASNPQSNLSQIPSLPATADSPKTNQQTSNSSLATNSEVSIQQLPSQLPALSAPAGDSTSFRPTQQTPKKTDSQTNALQHSVQSSTLQRGDIYLRDQPKSQLFQSNLGTSNPNPNIKGINANSLPAMLGTPSKSLQLNSPFLPSNFPQPISPLSKTLTFPNQIPPPQSPLKDSASNRLPLPQSSNAAQHLTSLLNNTRVGDQLTPVTRDALTHPTSNSQMLSNVDSSVNSLSNNPVSFSENQVSAVREPPTRLEQVSVSQDVTDKEPALNFSSKSQEQAPESKTSVSDSPSKSNGQVPPVDVRLTINFNANLPGFPGNPQQLPNPTQAATGSPNNTQLNVQPSPQGQPSSIPPIERALPTRPELNQQFQSIPAAQNNFPESLSGLPVELLTLASSSHLHSQSDFQVPKSFSPSYHPQFDVRGFSHVPQGSSIRTQPFSQFLNAKAGSVNSQFNSFGSQFDLQSSQFPTIQGQLARFNQNSQISPANAASQISSQFNVPGRPFEVQTQQPPTQDFSARFQTESQFQNTNVGSLNTPFNNFGSQTRQASHTLPRPVPQVFTANAGLAVNSLSYSPGLSVELLPPVIGDYSNSFKRSEFSTTNEQPRVSFLVNSPELSADLLPPVVSQSSIYAQSANSRPVQPSSPQLPITPSSPTIFDPSAQFVPVNVHRTPEPSIELLPPLDPFFPHFSQNPNEGLPPNPIDIPKPLVPALVPPPRERIAIPIDIPRPAVPALVPPPRKHIETPIDIPKPDVPALVPPPREHTETPIDIPRPYVPALVPPPRPSELAASARFLPPTPTSFTFKPPGVSRQENVPNPETRPLNPNANLQSQQIVQTSTDNPVLILPKSSSRPQGRSNNPLSIEDLSKRVGFLPQNTPAPFSHPVKSSSTFIPTIAQSQTDSVFQITDIRAGRVHPLAQEVLRSNIPSQSFASSQSTFLRTPVSLSLESPFFPTSGTGSQPSALGSVFSNESTKTVGQPSIDGRLTSTIRTPTQTLLPPVDQGFTLPTADTSETNPFQSPFTPAFGTSLTSAEPPVVNIVPPKKNAESAVGQTTSHPQSQQTLPQSPQEGFIIFQTPTITVTSQTNRPDSQINVTVVTQGGTGHIKPNTTLTAEPVRPVNQTLKSHQQLFASTPPAVSSSTLPDLPNILLPPLDQRTSSTPIANLLPPLETGIVRNNFTSNPFVPHFSQPPFSPLTNPSRFSNTIGGASPGTSASCPKLDLQHKGHRAPQISGPLILSPGFYPIDDPTRTRCDNRGRIDGKKFNWWQILLNYGGEPSTLSRENESEGAKLPALTNPCVRPFETEGVPAFYNITKTDSRTYYREEIAYHRFPDSKNTFLESRGLFVWTQAKSSLDSTAYLVLYTRDDSGFWLQVKSVNCKFDRNVQPNLQCQSVPECFCDSGEKRCSESVPVLTRNFPVKTFRF